MRILDRMADRPDLLDLVDTIWRSPWVLDVILPVIDCRLNPQ